VIEVHYFYFTLVTHIDSIAIPTLKLVLSNQIRAGVVAFGTFQHVLRSFIALRGFELLYVFWFAYMLS